MGALAATVLAFDIKGVNLVGMPYTRVHLGDPYAKQALEHLATTGATWVSLPVTFFQDFKNSSLAYKGVHPFILQSGVNECSPEKDYASLVRHAKALGLKVMLQFQVHINAPYWPATASIGDYWGFYNPWMWFQRYFELVASTLQAVEGVDLVSLGHDNLALSFHEPHWKNLTLKLRNVTAVPLTYSAAFGEEERKAGFWDHLDFVGVFPKVKAQSADALAAELKEFARTLLYMHKLWKKPVIVTRVAACSKPSAAVSQAQLFEAVHAAVKDLDFVKGIIFGDWPADISYAGDGDVSYSVQWKPAQAAITRLFGGSGQTFEQPAERAAYTLNCDCYRAASTD